MNVSDDSPNGEEKDVQSHMCRPTITEMQKSTVTIFTLFKANIQSWRPLAATTRKVARLRPRHFFLWFHSIGWPAEPQTPLRPWEDRSPPQTPRPEPKAPYNLPCAQAHIARTAKEHEALMARDMTSNHTCSDRPLPTCRTSIVVTATMFTSFNVDTKETTKKWSGRKQRHLFCGGGQTLPPLYIGLGCDKYRSGHHDTCPACR